MRYTNNTPHQCAGSESDRVISYRVHGCYIKIIHVYVMYLRNNDTDFPRVLGIFFFFVDTVFSTEDNKPFT